MRVEGAICVEMRALPKQFWDERVELCSMSSMCVFLRVPCLMCLMLVLAFVPQEPQAFSHPTAIAVAIRRASSGSSYRRSANQAHLILQRDVEA